VRHRFPVGWERGADRTSKSNDADVSVLLRSGIISLSWLRCRRDATPHWRGLNRGPTTSTVPKRHLLALAPVFLSF
jgi:hypothetical protein